MKRDAQVIQLTEVPSPLGFQNFNPTFLTAQLHNCARLIMRNE